MASPTEVKHYLSCWFQLGKEVILSDPAGARRIRPNRILSIENLSSEFEECWQTIYAAAHSCALEGTNETIAELLTDRWEITECARCHLSIPLPARGATPEWPPCPCSNLHHWPSFETLPPRCSGDTFSQTARFSRLRQSLEDQNTFDHT
jgi:hypothetical protein